MKNQLILISILLYMCSIFLPWGPAGTNVETGFNEEASPGLLGMILVAISFYYALKTSKKAYYILIASGILLALLPAMVINQILKNPSFGLSDIGYGVYSMSVSALLLLFGSSRQLKKAGNANNNPQQ